MEDFEHEGGKHDAIHGDAMITVRESTEMP